MLLMKQSMKNWLKICDKNEILLKTMIKRRDWITKQKPTSPELVEKFPCLCVEKWICCGRRSC